MVDIDKALCMALKEAISDERAAPAMYRKLLRDMKEEGIIDARESVVIEEIIEDEERHEEFFVKLAERKGCQLSTIKEPRKLYADLPLSERIKLAKEAQIKMEEVLGV